MRRFRHRFTAMGGPCELQLHADDEPADLFARGEAVVRRLEQKYSRYRDDSTTTALNRSAGAAGGIEVDEETAGLLDFAHTAWQQSDGLFDVTSGVLRRAWDFKAKRVPSQAQIDAALAHVGWARVRWNRPHLQLAAGMEIDLGGVVKEYAADCAARVLREGGARHGLVELGGDIAVLGAHPDGSPWQVGIRHPRDPENSIATLELREGAIASSGDYERYFESGGHRYCHILNAKSGWPVEGLASVSVVAPQCLVAGAASTIAMLKGVSEGPAWLRSLDLPHFCVASDGAISGTLAAQRNAKS